MNKRAFVSVIILVLTMCVGFLYFGRVRTIAPSATQNMQCEQRVRVGNTVEYCAERADTPEERSTGLGGRNRLNADEAMYFVFGEPGTYRFWMKDMKFAIDIIWADANGTIIHVEENVSPSTYPQTFTSEQPAQYVLELVAGQFAQHNLVLGDTIEQL